MKAGTPIPLSWPCRERGACRERVAAAGSGAGRLVLLGGVHGGSRPLWSSWGLLVVVSPVRGGWGGRLGGQWYPLGGGWRGVSGVPCEGGLGVSGVPSSGVWGGGGEPVGSPVSGVCGSSVVSPMRRVWGWWWCLFCSLGGVSVVSLTESAGEGQGWLLQEGLGGSMVSHRAARGLSRVPRSFFLAGDRQ